MRVPYVVGRWVRGPNHYGRERLVDYILNVDGATWVVGTRRMGKTSLLRQLELRAQALPERFVTVFWDLQGCQTLAELAAELRFSIEDAAEHLQPLGLDPEQFDDDEVLALLDRAGRAIEGCGRRLLLLIDEAEALISIGREHPQFLSPLRQALQSPPLQTVMTSTKVLTQLNDLGCGQTPPFLLGFNLVNLWSLDPEASVRLVRQLQTDHPVAVSDGDLQAILETTNRHPYLMQFLCQRLFVSSGEEHGRLRSIEPDDLKPDQLLAGFFHVDYGHLAGIERRILLALASTDSADEQTLLAALSDETPDRVRTFLYGLNKLGFIRAVVGRWTIGNDYLRSWLAENAAGLSLKVDSEINEQRLQDLLEVGARTEAAYLRRELAQLTQHLRALEWELRTSDNHRAEALAAEIERTQWSLGMLEGQLTLLSAHLPRAALVTGLADETIGGSR